MKVGDKVRVNEHEGTPNDGAEGTIICVEIDSVYPYTVSFNPGTNLIEENYTESELELIEEAPASMDFDGVADLIAQRDALQAQIEDLNEELRLACEHMEACNNACDKNADILNAVRFDRDRYKAALSNILDNYSYNSAYWAGNVAYIALHPKE